MKNGLNIEITWLPACLNVSKNTPNPYIGMSGEVQNYNGKTFDLFTGTSYLVGINVFKVTYKLISTFYKPVIITT